MLILFHFVLRFFRTFAVCCFPITSGNSSKTLSSSSSSSSAVQEEEKKPLLSEYKPTCCLNYMPTSTMTIPSAISPLLIKRPTLPLQIDELNMTPSRSTPTTPSCASVLRVLVVDDNPLNLRIMNRLLRSKHFINPSVELEPEVVESGEIALERLSYNKYHLILMDLDMPGISGIEACKLIRAPDSKVLESNKLIPIVAVSADDDAASMKLAREAGMDGFVPKPVLINDLKVWIDHSVRLFKSAYQFGGVASI